MLLGFSCGHCRGVHDRVVALKWNLTKGDRQDGHLVDYYCFKCADKVFAKHSELDPTTFYYIDLHDKLEIGLAEIWAIFDRLEVLKRHEGLTNDEIEEHYKIDLKAKQEKSF